MNISVCSFSRISLFIIKFVLSCVFCDMGMDGDAATIFGNKRVGLALSGGGARGFAHLGVLQALEELGIEPSIVAGVSAGSIVAVMKASGMKAADIAQAFGEMSMGDFAEIAIPKNGFMKLTKLKEFLKKRIAATRIEELPLKTVVCATDFDNCRPVAFEQGPIGDCVTASCSIPIVFQPVKIGGTTYVDGGVLRNLPAWAIRDKCDVLVGVNVSPMPGTKYHNTLLDIASRSYDIMSRGNAREDIALCDIAIQPHGISELNVFNIKPKNKIIKSGYDEAMAVMKDFVKQIDNNANNRE